MYIKSDGDIYQVVKCQTPSIYRYPDKWNYEIKNNVKFYYYNENIMEKSFIYFENDNKWYKTSYRNFIIFSNNFEFVFENNKKIRNFKSYKNENTYE
jgi:hypothetical protein